METILDIGSETWMILFKWPSGYREDLKNLANEKQYLSLDHIYLKGLKKFLLCKRLSQHNFCNFKFQYCHRRLRGDDEIGNVYDQYKIMTKTHMTRWTKIKYMFTHKKPVNRHWDSKENQVIGLIFLKDNKSTIKKSRRSIKTSFTI